MIISLKNSFKNFDVTNSLEVNIGTGVMLGNMVRTLTKKSVIGLESLVGVPGTLGGALIMNAGAYGSEISNYLVSVLSIDVFGNEKIYNKDDINFNRWHKKSSRHEIRTISRTKDADYKVTAVSPDKLLLKTYRGDMLSINIKNNEDYYIDNILFSVALATEAGASISDVKQGIESFEIPSGRFNKIKKRERFNKIKSNITSIKPIRPVNIVAVSKTFSLTDAISATA